MSPRPVIFISAVSKELASARQIVAKVLEELGCEGMWLEALGAEPGQRRGMLRRRIDGADGVVQIVGRCYGVETTDAVAGAAIAGRCSDTQYEAYYALARGKRIWYLCIDDVFPVDPHGAEPEELRALQADYRKALQAGNGHLRVRTTATLEWYARDLCSALRQAPEIESSGDAEITTASGGTEARRAGERQTLHPALGLVIVILFFLGCGGGMVWMLRYSRDEFWSSRAALPPRPAQHQHGASTEGRDVAASPEALARRQQEEAAQRKREAALQRATMEFPDLQVQIEGSMPVLSTVAVDQSAFQTLAARHHLTPLEVQEALSIYARELRLSRASTTAERANAAFSARLFVEAERLCLQAAHEEESLTPPHLEHAVLDYEVAGAAALAQPNPAKALRHYRTAVALVDRERNPITWAHAQRFLGNALCEAAQFSAAEAVYREALEVMMTHRRQPGADPMDVPLLRISLSHALLGEDKAPAAERELRVALTDYQRLLGPEHRTTLDCRVRIAYALDCRGKSEEAEREYRGVLAIQERVLGPNHHDTLETRSHLAVVLNSRGRYAAAEHESGAAIAGQQSLLPPDNLDLLGSRMEHANALSKRGKYVEAEREYREVLSAFERVKGPEYYPTMKLYTNLAETLRDEGRVEEAEAEYRAALELQQRVLGPENALVLSSRAGLGSVLSDRGKYAEAEREFRAVLPVLERVLGVEHPRTLTMRANIAIELANQHEYAAAEKGYRAVLAIRERVLGPAHPDVLHTCYCFASCLFSQGQKQEALALARRAAEGRRIALGPDHPDTKLAESRWRAFAAGHAE